MVWSNICFIWKFGAVFMLEFRWFCVYSNSWLLFIFFFYLWCNWNLKWKETKKKCQNGKYCECQMLRIFDEMIEKLFRPHTRALGWQHIHDIRNCWLPKSQSLMAWNSNGINYLFTLRLYKSVDILLLLSTLISAFIRFAMLTSDDDEYIVSIDFVCRTCNVSYLFDSFTVCVFFFLSR